MTLQPHDRLTNPTTGTRVKARGRVRKVVARPPGFVVYVAEGQGNARHKRMPIVGWLEWVEKSRATLADVRQ